MMDFLKKHHQTLVNVFLFLTIGYWAINRAYEAWGAKELSGINVLFFTDNMVMVLLILVRRQHVSISRNVLHQGVALVAFFSGIAFDDKPQPLVPALGYVSLGVIIIALVLGVMTMLNLGRSFGILIAVRKIKSRGLYGVIRHPMYFADILLRVGFILGRLTLYNAVLFVVSTAAYVYRAHCEERFLRQYPDYQEYMTRVKYRFLPGIY